MSRANDQAFPRHEKHFDGLTLREYLVGQVLAGYSVRPGSMSGHIGIGRTAVEIADEAIRAMRDEPL